jgi:hypothetical protein
MRSRVSLMIRIEYGIEAKKLLSPSLALLPLVHHKLLSQQVSVNRFHDQ